MDIEVVYSFKKQAIKKEPKAKGKLFTGVKIKDRWGNVYDLYPFYGKNWDAFIKEMKAIGYEAISYDTETAS